MILQIHGEDDAFSPTDETKESLVLLIDCSEQVLQVAMLTESSLKMTTYLGDGGRFGFFTPSLLSHSHNTPCLPPKILHKYCFQVLFGGL